MNNAPVMRGVNCSTHLLEQGQPPLNIETVKIAVLAPIPSANVRTVIIVKAGFARSIRTP